MIILDTSIWIEFLKGNPDFYKTVKHLLENRQITGIEWIFGELLQGAKNKREKKIIISYWECLPKINTSDIWLDAGIYSSDNKLFSKGIGLIDCAIIMAARKNNLRIWSLDKKLKSMLKKDEIYSGSQ